MASRDNQTLQISLMAFAILVVILAVTTYWFYSNWEKEFAKSEDLSSQISNSKDNTRKLIEEDRELKQWMGVQPDDPQAEMKKKYEEDMQQYAAEIEAAEQTYSNVLGDLFADKQAIALREADAKKQLKQLKAEMLALEGQKNEQIKQHAEEAKTAKQDLAAERKVFNGDREKFKIVEEELTTERDKIRGEFEATLGKRDESIVSMQKELDGLKRKLKMDQSSDDDIPGEEKVEMPTGLITWVDQRTRNVWVDLGHSDALRPQVSFSVYSPGQVIDGTTTPKAKIEVVRILESHLSQARIVSDELADPILPNDLIFSTVWRPGSRVHFALSGILDLDGDGKTDLSRVRDIIRINGGVIDEYVSDEGERAKKGEGMTIDTKFLVVGKIPTPTDATLKKIHGATTAMRDDSDALGVRRINLQTFLDMMGWEAGERSIPLGKGARARDFPAKLPGGVQKLDSGGAILPEDTFRKRHPPTPY